jgi:hypothetical protein
MLKRYISPEDDADIAENEPLLEFRITNKRMTSSEKVPPDVEKLAPYFLDHLRNNPQKTKIREEVLPKLERLLEKHPTSSFLYNFLAAALEQLGEFDRLDALVEEQYHKNPHYIFARLNYAHRLLELGRVSEIPDALAHTFTLHELFPEYKEFHVTEAVGFSALMALYQHTLGHTNASEAWLELASEIEPKHPQLQKIIAHIKRKAPQRDSSQAGNEHFPPSMNIIFMTPEQDMIDFLTPMLPVPCTLLPSTAVHLHKQGVAVSPKTQVSIMKVLDGAHEGGVLCEIGTHDKNGQESVLIVSLTHLIIKPKHKAEIRVQAYQRKRIAQIAPYGRGASMTSIMPKSLK